MHRLEELSSLKPILTLHWPRGHAGAGAQQVVSALDSASLRLRPASKGHVPVQSAMHGDLHEVLLFANPDDHPTTTQQWSTTPEVAIAMARASHAADLTRF